MTTYRKKLIEVALPLEAINKAAKEEKAVPRHGHPQALHYWWARRPLAACRAVLFASLVDDPSSHPEQFPTEEAQDKERQRLFRIIEELVKWENSNNETVLNAARAEILKSTNGHPPPVLDPFCGGGSIPLEAQRLALEAHASDLNPVAVLITKALIEIPPKFAGKPPVNPEARKKLDHSKTWHGAQGLAEDVRYYGQWMRDEAERRIGHLYPKVKLPKEQGGGEATVIAWLWARTVKCPNPACGVQMPLARSFWLCGKKAWAEPVVDRQSRILRFLVKTGSGNGVEGTVNRRGARCIACNTVTPLDYVREEARAGRVANRLMATVSENGHHRRYLSPTDDHESIARTAAPTNVPDNSLPDQALGFRVQLYVMTKHRDLFTSRQLASVTTFSDLVGDAWHRIFANALDPGVSPRGAKGFELDAKTWAAGYADAVSTYLGCALSRLASYNNAICFWNLKGGSVTQIFSRQAISMSWDFIEINPLEKMSGNWVGGIEWVAEVIEKLAPGAHGRLPETPLKVSDP